MTSLVFSRYGGGYMGHGGFGGFGGPPRQPYQPYREYAPRGRGPFRMGYDY